MGKEPKKGSKKTLWIVAIVVVVLIGMCNLGDDDTSTSSEAKKSVSTEDYYQNAISELDNGNYNKSKQMILSIADESYKSKVDSILSIIDKKIEAEKAETQKRIASLVKNMRTDKDEVQGITWYYDKSSPRYLNSNGIFLYFGESSTGLTSLRLKIQYYADDWLFIKSYQFLADSSRLTHVPSKVEQDNEGGKIWEWSDDPLNDVSRAIVEKIANSKSVTMRVNGRQYYSDKTVTSAQKNALKRMMELYDLKQSIK